MSISYVKKPSYNTVFLSVFFLFLLTIFSLNKQINGAYYLFSFLGIYAWRNKLSSFSDSPPVVKRYFYIVMLLTFIILVSILIYHPSDLFKWRFSVYRDLILFPFVLIAFYASDIKYDTFLKTLVLAGFFMTSLWVVMILITQPEREVGWLSQPIDRGNIAVCSSIICLLASVYFNDSKWKLLAAIGSLTGVLLSILSTERGGWVALVVVMCTLIFIFFRYNKAAIKYILPILLIITSIVLFFWDYLPIEHRIKATINSVQSYYSGEDKPSSVGIRLEMLRAAWYAFLEKPLFGWGWNNSAIILEHFKEIGVINSKIVYTKFHHFHNQYALFLAELGIIGFFTFSVMITYPLHYLITKFNQFYKRKDNNNATICLIPVILCEALLVCSLFELPFSLRPFLYLLIITTTFSITYLHKSLTGEKQQ